MRLTGGLPALGACAWLVARVRVTAVGRHIVVGGLGLLGVVALLGAVAPVALADTSAYTRAVESDGPTAYYQLGDASGSTQAADSAGANPLTAYNGVTFGVPGPSGVGTTAVSLNGSSQYLAADSSVVSEGSNWTIEGWFQPSSSSQAGMMAYDGNGASGFGFGQFYDQPGGTPGSCLQGLYGAVAWFSPRSDQCFASGTWYYLALEHGAASGWTEFFVDGTLVYPGSWSGGIETPKPPQGGTEIGAQFADSTTTDPADFFQGAVSQVAFYNYALSQEQIQTHYAAATDTQPASTASPTISGDAEDGQVLSVSDGSWSGSAPLSYTYQWQDCDANGGNCQDIAGATNAWYQLGSSDVGQTVRAQVTASNPAGSGSTSSPVTATVAPSAPSNVDAPPISGSPAPGQQLTASPGDWAGTVPMSYTYQWQSCDGNGANCQNIPGATQSSYTVGNGDLGNTLDIVVAASNVAGTATATSTATAPVGFVPTNSHLPVVSGTAQDGQTLSVSNGDWSGSTPISYGYQWQDCDSSGNNCQDISGATGSSYDVASSDVDSTLVVQVTAVNAVGATTVATAATPVVTAVAPANTALPTVSGTAEDGQTVSASGDSWSGTTPLSYAYQWQRCDASGGNCRDIDGASEASYSVASADVGSTLLVKVTASNQAGSATAASVASQVVVAAPPTSTTMPTVTGTPEDGQTLSASNGDWSGTAPLSYSYQWEQCDSTGANCQSISGATGASYTAQPTDVGVSLVAEVTATNSAGTATAASSPTGPVFAAPPGNTTAPAISGVAQDGQTLSADPGAWSGTGPFSYGYQWERCDSTGQNCQDITNAWNTTYQLTSADVGATIVVQVSAYGSGGEAAAASAVTAVVEALAPANRWAPRISGTPQSGLTLRAVASEWSGTTPLTYSYQWLSCDSSGASCTPIAGATEATYTPGDQDVGATIEVAVTVTNAGGSASATSAASATVASAAPSTVTITYGYDANGRLTSVSGR